MLHLCDSLPEDYQSVTETSQIKILPTSYHDS